MTFEELKLLDESEALLKQTTVGYAGHSAAWRANRTTKWWQALEKLRQAREGEPPEPGAQPKSLWPHPLTNPIEINVTDGGDRFLENLDPARDYTIRCRERLTAQIRSPGALTLKGGRNIDVVAAEIYDDASLLAGQPVDDAYGIYLIGQRGTVHLEGFHVHGRGIGQALILNQREGATVQTHLCRFETLHPVGDVHTDGIQSWAGPARLRLGHTTIRTAGVGIQTMPHQYGPLPLDLWERRFVNVEQTTDDAYALWKGAHAGGWWRELNQSFYVRRLGYFAWPDFESWNPGGPARVEGEALWGGSPPGGDFCPAGVAGLNYRVAA